MIRHRRSAWKVTSFRAIKIYRLLKQVRENNGLEHIIMDQGRYRQSAPRAQFSEDEQCSTMTKKRTTFVFERRRRSSSFILGWEWEVSLNATTKHCRTSMKLSCQTYLEIPNCVSAFRLAASVGGLSVSSVCHAHLLE